MQPLPHAGGQPVALLHGYDPTTGICSCPGCRLALYMNTVVYGSQKLASADVMAEIPSQHYRGQPPPPAYGGVVTAVNGVARPTMAQPEVLKTCPMYDRFGFCMYGRTCLLPHEQKTGVQPLLPPPLSVDDALQAVIAMGEAHMQQTTWKCMVCGFGSVLEAHATKVGETYAYRYCPNCTVACYLPQVLALVELTIDAVGDDYSLYKELVDYYRFCMPDLLKIPMSYEAHRIATTLFAWSLVGPDDALYALEAVYHHCPQVDAVVSLGAGTGYVEHVFNRVANGLPARPHNPRIDALQRILGPRAATYVSSFEGKVCPSYAGSNRQLSFFSFDEIVRPVQFSVAVNYGAPQVLLSLNCSRSALLLSWPPFGSPEEEQSSMGFESLRHYTNHGGQVVIYIGDVSSTGDWRFHALLAQEYTLCSDYYVRKELRRWCPQDMGLVYAGCDTIGVYVRRQPHRGC